ncbi:MAG: hypothetical protein QXT54_01210 [Thermoplasmatales archaeon]
MPEKGAKRLRIERASSVEQHGVSPSITAWRTKMPNQTAAFPAGRIIFAYPLQHVQNIHAH